MKPLLRYVLPSVIILAAMTAALGGCRVGYPFRGPGYDAEKGVVAPNAGETVVVAITSAEVTAGSGDAFSEQLRAVLETMDQHDGLIGYSVRRELLGNRVWTMSVWVDRRSLHQFLRSPAHRTAVARGGIPSDAVTNTVLDLPVSRVPLSWDEAERLLAQ